MLKYYTVEVKFFGVGPTGPISYENRFPESGAKSLRVPDQAQGTKQEAGI